MADNQRGRLGDIDCEYYITIGQEYVVAGMSNLENILNFLILDDTGGPAFVPAGLFELGSSEIPGEWMFAIHDGIRAAGREMWEQPCSATWGYSDLVLDPDHAEALLSGDKEAFSIFFANLQDQNTSEG